MSASTARSGTSIDESPPSDDTFAEVGECEGSPGERPAERTRHTTASTDAGARISGVLVTPPPVASSPRTTSTWTPDSPTFSLSTTSFPPPEGKTRLDNEFFATREPKSSSSATEVSQVARGTTIVGASSATSSRIA